jgi:hypothetical protein
VPPSSDLPRSGHDPPHFWPNGSWRTLPFS